MTQTVDPFDELAAMFLTEPDGPAGARAEVELLLVGHLPVRAGLWIGPYVDGVAKRSGPTALIRLEAGMTRIELLRSAAPLPGETTDLRAAIETLAPVVRTWMIRPGAQGDAADLVASLPDRYTVLTGANEAAVIQAYRVIRGLAEAAAEREHRLPPVGLAVLGADHQSAERVVGGLRRTAAAVLGIEPRLVACIPRIDAGMVSSGELRLPTPPQATLATVLQWIRDASRRAADAAPTPPVQPPTPAPTPGGTPGPGASPAAPVSVPVSAEARPRTQPGEVLTAEAVRHRQRSGDPPSRGVVEIDPTTAQRAAPPDAPEAPVARRTVRLFEKVPRVVEPKEAPEPGEPSEDGRPVPLASFVEGLTPIAARCPGRERVELAVDVAGRLHLLGREETLREMRYVDCWARDHRELLSLACPEHDLDPRGAVICHVFSAAPTTLGDLHGTDLRLHVLAPVHVDGRVGWYSAPLNVAR